MLIDIQLYTKLIFKCKVLFTTRNYNLSCPVAIGSIYQLYNNLLLASSIFKLFKQDSIIKHPRLTYKRGVYKY